MKRRGNAFEAIFYHPGKKSESKAVSEDKQQEARSSPSLTEVVKQEGEVPLGLRQAGQGAGLAELEQMHLPWKSQVQAPLWLCLSEPQFPHFKVVKNGDKIHPTEWLRGLNGKNVNMLC